MIKDSLEMANLLSVTTRGLVNSQMALDDRAIEDLKYQSENGLPASAFVWRQCLISCSVQVATHAKSDAGSLTQLILTPRGDDNPLIATLSFSIRQLPPPDIKEEP